MIRLALFIFILFTFLSCSLFVNDQPDISIIYNGRPVQFSLEIPDNTEIYIDISASDPDGIIESVYLQTETDLIDITALDADTDDDTFTANCTLQTPDSGEVSDIQVIVNDNMAATAVKEFQLDCLSTTAGDAAYPVEMVIPEIQIADGGMLYAPAPSGEVYYFNAMHTREESDIQLDEPIYNEMSVKRYLKVTGSAIPDDSGYSDREYHAVLFTTDNGSTKSYITIPVNREQRFRGYLYFPEPGTYTVMAYRAWDEYLYPNNRSTDYTVNQGNSTLRFSVQVGRENAVPAEYHHLIPTRNVDNGTRYLREYAGILTKNLSGDMEKVQAIFEFIANGDANGTFAYRYYDEIYPGYLDNCWSDIFIASHFLDQRQGVCNDFSELFAALTRSLGFKVQKVWGYVPGATGHQWNRIFVNGTWYRLDATWACGSPDWKQFAEFYPVFDAAFFQETHENRYNSGYTIEY